MQDKGTKVIYFAYGSNMFSNRLKAYNRAPEAKKIGIGYTKGRRLTFNKKSNDGSGKCTIEKAPTDNLVWGVLYEINSQEKDALDKVEIGYRCDFVDVVTGGRTMSALTYIAAKTDVGLKPTVEYLDLVVKGAIENGLPAEHIELIRKYETG